MCLVISEHEPIQSHASSIGHRTRTFSYTRDKTGECSFKVSYLASVPYAMCSWHVGHFASPFRNHSSKHARQKMCLFSHKVTTGCSQNSEHILHVNSSTLSERTWCSGNPLPPMTVQNGMKNVPLVKILCVFSCVRLFRSTLVL